MFYNRCFLVPFQSYTEPDHTSLPRRQHSRLFRHGWYHGSAGHRRIPDRHYHRIRHRLVLQLPLRHHKTGEISSSQLPYNIMLFHLFISDLSTWNKVHQNVWLHTSFLIFYGSLIGYLILLPPEVVLWLVTKILFRTEVVLCSQSEYQRLREMVSSDLMNLIGMSEVMT